MTFIPFCQSFPSTGTSLRNNKTLYHMAFFTRSLPIFEEYLLLFYKNNKKIVPLDIYNLLTPLALAHWIMGDGQKRTVGLVLCTDSYTIQETVLFISVLILRYNFICTLREVKKNQYRIYISEKSMNSLRNIVSPYMIDSMLYKLNKNCELSNLTIICVC